MTFAKTVRSTKSHFWLVLIPTTIVFTFAAMCTIIGDK